MAKHKHTGKVNRRSDILRAAEKLIESRGLSGVTTRQISEEVGCSEGALYVHFKGRLELLLAMLEGSLPGMLQPLEALTESVGHGSPSINLVRALEGIFRFHQRIVPITRTVCGTRSSRRISQLSQESRERPASVDACSRRLRTFRTTPRAHRLTGRCKPGGLCDDVGVFLSCLRGTVLWHINSAAVEAICRTTSGKNPTPVKSIPNRHRRSVKDAGVRALRLGKPELHKQRTGLMKHWE